KEWSFVSYENLGGLPEREELYGGKIVETIAEDGHEVFVFHPLDEDLLDNPSIAQYFINKAYEEDGVVWVFSWEDKKYIPMVDFNLEVGDSLFNGWTVAWKERFVIEGIERYVLAIQNSAFRIVDYWVEGIGAVGDTYVTPLIVPTCYIWSRIIECKIGDRCLLQYDKMDSYLSDVRALKADREDDAPIYDMLGRRISTPAPGQLYIQGGKKYIAK
ncbi:MAG: hypothetical protein K2L11_03135, partial [Muribaculaceae bacterium]|nr:hypothetical protein [Muribaculaceae bacterium]